MGVRPPSDDSDEPDVIEFGIAALDGKLPSDDLEFPATAGEIRAHAGTIEVPYDPAGHTMTVGEALDESPEQRFETEQDLLNALHPVFERKRLSGGTSLLAQLRSLVPF
ncbi:MULTISPECIES: hypothetical protein [Haloarcula]|uniref:DUF5789 family protein n=1 Tax=Haloarcula TaxID=2237 RepID=UPI0023EC79EF|nr:hypothetical protein [Halomicroarcula sp. XH51]